MEYLVLEVLSLLVQVIVLGGLEMEISCVILMGTIFVEVVLTKTGLKCRSMTND
jgi:hypothetical protein